MNIQKIISVILSVCVIFGCMRGVSASAEEEIGNNVTINYTSVDGLTKSFEFLYDDSFFFSDSYTYSRELSLLSMGMSMASFTAVESVSEETEENIVNPNSNIIDAYKKIGFVNPVCYNYDKPLSDSSDKAAFSIACKTVSLSGKSTVLVAAVIRGGGYGAEWASNYNIGNEKYHTGFNTAAEEVYSSVTSYISEFQDKKNIRLWITGYSRGAAIANLTAEKFDRNNELPAENIFAYTFAAPLCSKDTSDKNYQVYENIFNIVNPADIVTNVPMSDWGYYRYGNDLVLPMLVSGIGFAKETKLKSSVKSKYNKINGMLTFSNNDKHIADVEKIKYSFLSQAESAAEYSEKMQQDICREIAKTDNDISAVMVMLEKAAGNTRYSVAEYADLFTAHYPELYLAWLTAVDDKDIFNKYSSFKKLTFTNADFVHIYSADGDMCVSVEEGKVKKLLIPAQINDDGSICVYLYGDSSFDIEFRCKTNSTAGYVIEEYNEKGSFARLVRFSLSEFTDKTVLKGAVPYALYCDKDKYMLSNGNKNIKADDDTGELEEGLHSIIVSSGTSSTYVAEKGEKVKVSLNIDKERYIFKGWTSDSQKLTVQSSESETAEFVMPNYAVRVSPILEEKEVKTVHTEYAVYAGIIVTVIAAGILGFAVFRKKRLKSEC